MKTLMVTALALLSLNAFAASVKVYESTTYGSENIIGSYGINPDMGRAWVELAIDNGRVGDDAGFDYDRAKVPGLSLVGNSVVLDVEGQHVECATVDHTRIFHSLVTKPTGNCVFKTKVVKTIKDDGFNTWTVNTLVVTLETVTK